MTWSAPQYSLFEKERNRPIVDLLAHVATGSVGHAIDLGCGPGNSTEILRARFADLHVRGIDSSAEMIEAAKARMPDVDFAVADITSWRDATRFDLILANAALQWVPDHAALLPRLVDQLAAGGTLAVQVPDNLAEPTHVLMRETALEGAWADRLAGVWKQWENRESADFYYRTLRKTGVSVDLWRTTYFHPLQGGAAAIVDWVRGSALRPFLDPLTEKERAAFLARYQAAIEGAYPADADGTVLLPFPRLFWIATK